MSRKTKIQGFILVAVWTITNLLSSAAASPYLEYSDSIRTTIRLQSYLLIHPDQFSEGEFNQLMTTDTPIALSIDTPSKTIFNSSLQEKIKKQHYLPVFTKKENFTNFKIHKNLVLIDPKQTDLIYLKDIQADSLFNDTIFTLKELIQIIPDSGKIVKSYIFDNIWSQSGKLPNFIMANSYNWEHFAQFVDSINACQKVFGVVKNEEQLLENVSWKDFPHRKTNGYFCFPMKRQFPRSLIPYNPGYRFSPDIILDSPENIRNLKEFKAIPLEHDFGLEDHFVFSKRLVNLKRDNENEIVNNGVTFTRDEKHRDCAFFANRAYIDCGIQSSSSLKPEFTVTAWIKPTKLSANNSILGKGKEFVLKLHDGYLTYTMQGVKDYFSSDAKIPLNQWSFISVVHSSYENKIRYYLNGKLTDEIDLLIPYTHSNNTILIGSNLWEEFFNGYIDDIKIWNRELSDKEIRNEFENKVNGNNINHSRILLLISLILIIVFFLIYFLLWKKRKIKTEKSGYKKKEVISEHHPIEEKLLCFGGLKILNSNGIDISHKLSPKLRQLFVLIYQNSIDGQKGISTKDLSETLWPGMNPQSSKNTRGTNIQNLKAVLNSCNNIRLIFHNKLWFMEVDDSCYSDYAEALILLDLFEKQGDKIDLETELPKLLSILKRGTLFSDMSISWLDPFISKMNDRIVDLGMKLFRELHKTNHFNLILELAEVISLSDPLHEPSLQMKLHILSLQGKLSLAHSIYDQFVRLYKELYQEDYPKDLKSLSNSVKF